MTFEQKWIHRSDLYKGLSNQESPIDNIYWGEVMSIEDETDGGGIRAKIKPDIKNGTEDNKIPISYPMQTKFFHDYPQIGEIVLVFIQDIKYPNENRYWMGPIISQLQKVKFDDKRTALSTTKVGLSKPEPAVSTIPEAKGVFPNKLDIGLIGRDNTDFILREKEVEIRAGKHEINTNLKLNKKNPASIKMTFEEISGITVSTNVTMADRIALISHEGIPKFKAAQLDAIDRNKIFKEAHPLGRGDTIVEALEILRKAILQHIHPYSCEPPDNSGIIIDLKNIDFNAIIQKNIRIN